MRKGAVTAAFLLFVICSLAASFTMAQQDHSDPAHSWTYSGKHGPKHWSELSSDFSACAAGKTESPINITHPHAAQLPEIHFSYQGSPVRIINNGHTIQINYAAGSTLTVGGKSYELVQVHFHHPSEEEINGKRYPMVAHLVHKNQQGNFAVVAVLIKEGIANPLINTLWQHLPAERDKELDLDAIRVNATDLLPSVHKYYTFAGSLTTPPCTEGVSWYVLETPISLSRAQIHTFARIYPANARPIQPLHGRLVQESK